MKKLFFATLIMGVAFLASCSSSGTDTDNPIKTPALTTDVESMSFSDLGKAKQIIITSNVEWVITPVEGVVFTPVEGKGNTTVSVQMAANETDKEVKNSFKIESTAPLKTINMTQAAKGQPSLGLSSETLYFTLDQISKTVTIYSDGDWEIIDATGKVKATPAKGRGNTVVAVEVTANTMSYEPVVTTLAVKAGKKELELVVTQAELPKDRIIIVTKGTLFVMFDARPELKTEPALKITGKMNDADFTTLKTATSGTLKSLDIAGIDTVAMPFNALQGYAVLTSLALPTKLTAIGNDALLDCSALEGLVVPPAVTTIGNNAFKGCTAMRSITFPVTLTSIGSDALRDCKALESVVIPSRVTAMLDNTFLGCTALKSATLPVGLLTMGKNLFSDCKSLESITIPGKVTVVEESTFLNCSSLAAIKFSAELVTIKESAFMGCSKLAKIELPATLVTLGDNAFKGCSTLTDITLSSSMTTIGTSAFMGCSAVSSIAIPNKVTALGEYAFAECSSLTSVTISTGLTEIKKGTFQDCKSLMNIIIPVKVATIGEDAFRGSMLLNVTCQNKVPPTLGDNAFADILTLKTLKVPKVNVADYQAAPAWLAAFGVDNIVSV